MKKRTLFVALTAALALAACSMPPYNEQLSLAQVTVSKLGKPANEIGPVYANLDSSAQQNLFYFLPDRDDPVGGGGFLVAEASYGLRVWYLSAAFANATLGSSWSIDLQNSNGNTNNYLLQPIKSATSFHLSLLRYTPSDAYASNDLRVIQATDPYTAFTVPSTTVLSTLLDPFGTSPVICAGSGTYATNNAVYDLQYFLGYSLGAGSFFEVEAHTDAANGVVGLSEISPPADFLLSPPLPSDLRNLFYGHELTSDTSYLSYPTGSGYRSFSWDSSSAPIGLTELTGIDGRIGAVLTNGQLLSFADGICTVHSYDGKKLFDFPLGALRFCYEQWDPVDLRYELYFSLAYWLWGRDEKSDQLYVEVYSIPTTSLASLK